MDSSDLLKLTTVEGAALIDKYIDSSPSQVAMATRNATLASAIKYLARAKSKLPAWYQSRALIDAQLFEQCSSQATAAAKFEGYSGVCALDLTCGLGVDSSALAAHFESVTTVEIDSAKAEIARYNFARLGLANIEVVNCSAEQFCESVTHSSQLFDLIYIDPSREANGGDGARKKVYSLEDSSPNIIELLPILKQLSGLIIIKLSPLFDVEECFRIFGDSAGVEVISLDSECKEVLVTLGAPCLGGKSIKHTIIKKDIVNRYIIDYQGDKGGNFQKLPSPNYIYVPDIAFYKSRCVEGYVSQLIDSDSFRIDSYIFSLDKISQHFEGEGFKIELMLPYSPKNIRLELKKRAIKRVTIHMRNFPYKLPEIQKSLALSEGSDAHLFFTVYMGKPHFFLVNLL